MIRKYAITILSALIVGTLALLLFAPIEAHAATPVIDEANVIPDNEEAVLNQVLVNFYKESGRQVAVATLKTLNGRDIQEVATAKFRELGVGSKELNDGVLFIASPSDRKMRIEVGYGLEEYLTDAKSGRILEGVKPYFRKEEYGPGITYATGAIINTISPDAIAFAAAEKKKEAIQAAKTREKIGNFFGWIGTIFAGLAALGGSVWLITLPGRRRKAREAEIARQLAEEEAQREREAYLARVAKQQAADRAEEALRREEENRRAEERERLRREVEERKEREWQEYLKNETPAQKRDRLAREEIERQNRIEAERIAAAAAAAAAVRAAEQRKADEAARKKRAAREEEERRERDRRSSYDSGYSSGSSWGSSSSSSDWGSSSSSSSSSSWDFGGGSSGGGGASGDW